MNTIRRETASAGTHTAPSTSSSSSSFSTHGRKYDAFLSFRGADTRNGFASVLFDHSKRSGLFVFRDNEGLQQGEEINPALEVAIRESRNAVVIVSPDFTKSKACMFELNVIMECWRMERLGVFPVFYHIDPSNVGQLTKDLENHFKTLEDHSEDKKAKWEYWKFLLDKIADWPVDPKLDEDPVKSSGSALKKLSDICAWVVPEKSDIIPHIDQICRRILAKMVNELPNIPKSLVGIESPVLKIMQLLDLENKNVVHVVGICGLGGIGKSILAEVIYGKLFFQFEYRYFGLIGKKKRNKEDLVSIKQELISNILPGAANLWNDSFKVTNALQTRLREKRVLIVLDDLWYGTQAKELVDPEWFGPGSRIIITSRKHDIRHLCKDNIYEVEFLNEDDALELFCLKAFKQRQPKEGFEKLSREVVRCAKGLPFALDIFGSYLLYRKDKEQWDGYIKELKNKVDDEVFFTLQKSVKELDDKIKELFFDIACFFNKCLKDDVLHILDGVKDFGDNLKHNLSVLVDKSLLRIFEGRILLMHDFVVDMGRQEAKSRRLLEKEDIVRVLKINATTQENLEVKGIDLKLHFLERETFQLKELSKMVNLRLLWIDDNYINFDDEMEELNEDFNYKDRGIKWMGDLSELKLRAELRSMKWAKYPLCSLPKDLSFGSSKLVELKLSFSHIVRLWDGEQSFPKLRLIDLSYSEKLIEIPNLRGVPKLEILNLQGCKHLGMVHSSVGHLKWLKELYLTNCVKLHWEKFPNILDNSPLMHLDVSSTCIEEHPFSSTRLPSLETFYADGAKMKELPYGIASSQKLRRIIFGHPTSKNQFQLPNWFSTLSSLEMLTLHSCYFSNEAKLSVLTKLSSLKFLDLSRNKFTKLPDTISELSILNELSLRCCTSLEALSKLPLSLHFLFLRNCPSLKAFYSQMTMLWESGSSSTVAYIGFKGKPYKIPYLHPKSPPFKSSHDYPIELAVACGPMQAPCPMQEPGIPNFFTHTSFGDSREIQIPMDWHLDNGMSKPWACALIIAYKVGVNEGESRKGKLVGPENSDTFPEFVCQLQPSQASRAHTFVVHVPEVACVGSHGLWVCINIPNSSQESEFVKRWTCQVSVTASNKNVVLMKGRARLLNRGAHAHLELANIIGLDSQTLALALHQRLIVRGPIEGEVEEYPKEENPSLEEEEDHPFLLEEEDGNKAGPSHPQGNFSVIPMTALQADRSLNTDLALYSHYPSRIEDDDRGKKHVSLMNTICPETASAGNNPAPSTSSSSASSSATHPQKYDIFLSAASCYEFTDSLFNALKRWGIIVFRDNKGLQQGEEINPALKVAIRESRNAAVIVSPDFTKSKACLYVLTVIMEYWRKGRLGVFPIFYHIDPSNVGGLTKDFENHLKTLEDHPEDKEAKWEYWKSLLDEIANLPVDPKLDEDPVESSGSAFKKVSIIRAQIVQEKSDIIMHIDQICRQILAKVISDLPNISNSLVGIESPVSKIMQLLDLEKKNEVRIVGICGMEGIGKSTLAEVVYKKLSSQFEGGYFGFIGKTKRSTKDLISVKKELLCNILPEAANFRNYDLKAEFASQSILHERRVLIVLDDLWFNTQVEELANDLEWFGPGSRIIITSRAHDLKHLCKDNVYEVEFLNKDDALKLFCLKAFKQPQPKEGFEKFSKEFVDRAEGLPLALEIFGSYLSNKKDKEQWGGYLTDLKNTLYVNIFDALQKIVEELDAGGKELFLDIACFFNKRLKVDVLHILDGVKDVHYNLKHNLKHNLSVLEEKSLLRIFEGRKLLMHDFVVNMARQEAKSSRLLEKEDIVHVLNTDAKTGILLVTNPMVKSVVLDVSLLKGKTFHLEELSTMKNLRVLWINDDYGNQEVIWKGDHSSLRLSEELRVMTWINYPFPTLVEGSNFESTNLVELRLSCSNIMRLWAAQKSFPKLRHIDLSFSEKLIETPNLSEVPKLEILNLKGCTSLLTVHSSIGDLGCLIELNLSGCFKLQNFPPKISSRSLEVFNLYCCGNLRNFPDIPYSWPLKHLDVSGTRFTEHSFSSTEFPFLETFSARGVLMKGLPPGFAHSKKLKTLVLCPNNSEYKFQFPDRFSDLSCLEMLYLNCHFLNKETLSVLRELPSLKFLHLNGNKFTRLLDSVDELSSLIRLTLSDCANLEALSKLPLSLCYLALGHCPSLKAFNSQMTISGRSGYSSTVAYIGFKDKPYKILQLHPRSHPFSMWSRHVIELAVACGPMQATGPTQEPGIPDFFIHRSFGDNKEIKIRMDWNSDNGMSKSWTYALMIVYKVYGPDEGESSKGKLVGPENLDIGVSKASIFPEFFCQLQANNRSREYSFIICAPEVVRVGSHGLWVCIDILNPSQEPESVKRWTCRVSVAASNKNVVLMEGGARLLDKNAHIKLANAVTGLDSETLSLALNHLIVRGPIKPNYSVLEKEVEEEEEEGEWERRRRRRRRRGVGEGGGGEVRRRGRILAQILGMGT